MKTVFKKYKPTEEEIDLIERFEGNTGFDLTGSEDVTDKQSLKECIKHNVRWLEDWAHEMSRDLSHYARRL